MISGYFRINRTGYSLKKLILETVFYGWLSAIAAVFIKICGCSVEITSGTIVSVLLLPVSTGYWFVTVYVLIMLASPVLNAFLRKMNRRGFFLYLGVFWVFWVVFAYFLNIQYADLFRGIFSYSVGAFCKLYLPHNQRKELKWNVLVAVVVWFLGAAMFYATSAANLNLDRTLSEVTIRLGRVVYRSIVSPVCAFAIFRIFEVKDIGYHSLVNRVAATTLGVYLISDSGILRDIIWHNIFKVEVLYAKPLFPLYACIIITVVFAVCSFVDYLRIRFIEPILLNETDKVLVKVSQWGQKEA